MYDFDENGVPSGADAQWRQETTDFWLRQATQNAADNKVTIICGVVVPTEVMRSVSKPDLPIYFGFIKISDEVIKQRLHERGWSERLIQDNIVWAHHLERDVEQQSAHKLIEASSMSPERVAQEFVKWIEKTTGYLYQR